MYLESEGICQAGHFPRYGHSQQQEYKADGCFMIESPLA